MSNVTQRECELKSRTIEERITNVEVKLLSEIKALRRELALAVTISTALITLFIGLRGW